MEISDTDRAMLLDLGQEPKCYECGVVITSENKDALCEGPVILETKN